MRRQRQKTAEVVVFTWIFLLREVSGQQAATVGDLRQNVECKGFHLVIQRLRREKKLCKQA